MKNSQSGYIALISGILISVSLLLLVVVVSFEGFFSRFTVFESDQKEISNYLAEACVQTAILEIAQNNAYSGNATTTVGELTCRIVTVTTGTFPDWRIIRTTASVDRAVTNLEVEIDTNSLPAIDIKSWEEVGSFP